MNRAILLHLLLLVLGLFPRNSAAQKSPIKEISILSINSAITPATYDYLKHQYKRVPENAFILIKMNTPGGLVSITKDIIGLIGTSKHPTAIWITPQGASAASAGAIIASGAHFIFMSAGTNIGAATPVGLGGDLKESDGRKKSLNDLTAMVRSLSDLRARPGLPFELMIKDAASYTDQEALKMQFIDGIISRPKDIIAILKRQNNPIYFADDVTIREYLPSVGQKILEVLTHPSTAYILFLVGIALIYFEFQAPGGYIAGSIGFCSLIVAAMAFQVLPLDWGSFGLILAGIFCIFLEMYVTSYGLLFIVGLSCFVMGSLFLFHDDTGFISVEYQVLYSALAGVFTGMGLITWFLYKGSRRSQPKDFFLPLGSVGIILQKLSEVSYTVKVRGEIWNANSLEELQPLDQVEVTSVDKNKLVISIKKTTHP